MHSLAIALKKKGLDVSGSDDEIYDPSKKRLEENGILPKEFGWHPEKITSDIDAVILGMHAKEGNPELEKAKELGLKIYSFPDFVRLQSEFKQRIVIAGSHGKTTITAIVMHILKENNRDFDYLIGAGVPGFDYQVKLSDAPVIIIEGDEYLTSTLDKIPKFLKYEHHIGLISGISWDHINAFPTMEEYVHQFDIFGDATPKAGSLVFCGEDNLATVIGAKERPDVNRLEYNTHPHKVVDGQTFLITDSGDVKVNIFGKHNMQNISGAKAVLNRIGIQDDQFYKHIGSFKSPTKRLQLVKANNSSAIYIDYAHAPSKVMATSQAIKDQYKDRKLTACFELHTFSSLNEEFIGQYEDSLFAADEAFIYVNPNNIKHASGMKLTPEDITAAFGHPDLKVFTDITVLKEELKNKDWNNNNLLLMSSGNFAGLKLDELAEELL